MNGDISDQPGLDARVDEIFDRALDLPRTERTAFLDGACGDDADVRSQVERLLAFSEKTLSRLESGVAAGLWPAADDAPVESGKPDRVGPYRILEEIGRGGMGVVYLGERADGHFEQEVAVKVTRPSFDSREVRRTFAQERQIIASLQHANIARLYDGGETDDGRPYSAMELVDGKPITVYCDEGNLSIGERLRLMEVVGSAVHHAHQNLVVHCDLKPSNILVTPTGEIKLLDFGIAKLLDAADADRDGERDSGARGMTPVYASPEQLRGEPTTTASDIFQLGLLLFELLTGERARPPRTLTHSGSHDVTAEEAPPRRPSAVALDAGSPALARALRGDLDAIVQTAMAEQPEQRYRSAAELVADLRRYRRHETLSVRSGTHGYRIRRFIRRNRLSVAIGTALILLLIGYSLTVTVQARKILEERNRAQRVQAFAIEIFGAGDPNQASGPQLSAVDLVAHGAALAEAELADEPNLLADVKSHLGNMNLRLGLHDQAEALFRDALELYERLHDEPHIDIAAAQHALGRLLIERDDPQALPLFESALAQRRQLLGSDHLDTVRTLSRLGSYLRSAGHRVDSEAYLRQALAVFRRNDPTGVDTANTLSELSWTLRWLDRGEEAESMQREALSIFRERYGDESSEVAEAWNDLANCLWLLQRWDEGDEAIQRSLEVHKRLYGDVHPSIAVIIGNHASALRKRGELARAADLYQQAIDMRREVLGESHPRVAQSLTSRAEVLREMGRLDEAEPLLTESLAMFEEHLPAEHPSLGRVLLAVGELLFEAGRLDEARAALARSRAIFAAVDVAAWPWRIDVMLAEIALKQGRLDDAAARLPEEDAKLRPDPVWTSRWQAAKVKLARD